MAEFSFDVSAAIDRLCSPLKTGLGILSADLGTCFKRYLTNAYENYNNIKTLVSRDTPRQIIGDDEIYVSVGVKYNDEEIDTGTVEPLLEISKNLIIEGTGGAGKTMLMKFLFLNTILNETYIPVLVKLNEISRQPVDEISIYDLIYKTIGEFSDDVTIEAFKHSLDSSKKNYLFLFDGFDEIAGSHMLKAAIAINDFCKRFPSNPCIITSRPGMDYTQLIRFTKTEMLPLNKSQAMELSSKICLDKGKAKSFCEKLDAELYEKHEEFAKNPLLLSMMFITFIDNGSIPDRIVDFYDKAYNALYSNHDHFKDGVLNRTFQSTLKANEFKDIFSCFCFDTFINEEYSFFEKDIIEILKDCLSENDIDEFEAENYLKDLETAVCLIIKDGTKYKFAHRSFQAYFAALYTEKLNDNKQTDLFNEISNRFYIRSISDYIKCIYQLEGIRFATNAFKKGLLKFNPAPPFDTIQNFKKLYKALFVDLIDNKKSIRLIINSDLLFGTIKILNTAYEYKFFTGYGAAIYRNGFNNFFIFDITEPSTDKIINLCHKADVKFKEGIYNKNRISFNTINNSSILSQEEKAEFYKILIEETNFVKLCSECYNLLNSLDENRLTKNASDDKPHKKYSLKSQI